MCEVISELSARGQIIVRVKVTCKAEISLPRALPRQNLHSRLLDTMPVGAAIDDFPGINGGAEKLSTLVV
jgi:hypothetical protein